MFGKGNEGAAPAAEERKFNNAWLKGIKVQAATKKSAVVEDKENGGKKNKEWFETVSRGAKPEDVMSWAEHEDHVVIVTMDGQKHEVKK